MADLSFNQMYTRLNTRLRDTDDFTFTQAEKQESLNSAMDDPYVYIIDRNSQKLTTATTASYPLPSNWEDVANIAIDRYGDGLEYPLDRSAWFTANGRLYFQRRYALSMPVGVAIIMYGKNKLTSSDFVPSFLQEYVLCRAAALTLGLLRSGKTNRFLRNDVTMQDLLAAGASWSNQAERLKATLHNHMSVRA